MRLSEDIQKSIIWTVGQFIGGINAELLLFGSRTNDSLRGGDIDLALLLEEDVDREKIGKEVHLLLACIKQALKDDERIDLIVTTRLRSNQDLFLLQALQNSICLHIYRS